MKKLIAGIVIITVGLFLLESLLGQDADRRNYQFTDDMVKSVAHKAQSTNPHLKSGYTQQEPVPGTIPRGYTPLHFGASEEGLVRAGKELVNPFAEGAEVEVARGKAVYENFCLVCHGAGGKGDGPVTKRGYPPPTSLLLAQAIDRSDGQMFHIITYGFKNMPPYASQVDLEDRWHAISYVRELQRSAVGNDAVGENAPEGEGEL